jgi:hypothetical protein
MVTRNQRNQQNQASSKASAPPASFVEGLASSPPPAPEAVAAAAAAIADVPAQAAAHSHADLIAAFYAGKSQSAEEVCTYLETNWGAESRAAAAEVRKRFLGVES